MPLKNDMKNYLTPLAIFFGAIFISVGIYYGLTYKDRAELKACMTFFTVGDEGLSLSDAEEKCGQLNYIVKNRR